MHAAVTGIKNYLASIGRKNIPVGPFPYFNGEDNKYMVYQKEKITYSKIMRPRSHSPLMDYNNEARHSSPSVSASPPSSFESQQQVLNNNHLLREPYEAKTWLPKIKPEKSYSKSPIDNFRKRVDSEYDYRSHSNQSYLNEKRPVHGRPRVASTGDISGTRDQGTEATRMEKLKQFVFENTRQLREKGIRFPSNIAHEKLLVDSNKVSPSSERMEHLKPSHTQRGRFYSERYIDLDSTIRRYELPHKLKSSYKEEPVDTYEQKIEKLKRRQPDHFHRSNDIRSDPLLAYRHQGDVTPKARVRYTSSVDVGHHHRYRSEADSYRSRYDSYMSRFAAQEKAAFYKSESRKFMNRHSDGEETAEPELHRKHADFDNQHSVPHTKYKTEELTEVDVVTSSENGTPLNHSGRYENEVQEDRDDVDITNDEELSEGFDGSFSENEKDDVFEVNGHDASPQEERYKKTESLRSPGPPSPRMYYYRRYSPMYDVSTQTSPDDLINEERDFKYQSEYSNNKEKLSSVKREPSPLIVHTENVIRSTPKQLVLKTNTIITNTLENPAPTNRTYVKSPLSNKTNRNIEHRHSPLQPNVFHQLSNMKPHSPLQNSFVRKFPDSSNDRLASMSSPIQTTVIKSNDKKFEILADTSVMN